MKILLAEDDPVFALLLQRLLEGEYEVLLVRDGVQAWEALQAENAPQLVVLDWLMPRMDGIEVCRQVRHQPELAPTYLILLTSRDHIKDILTGFEAGADDYVVKPCDPEELRARVRVGRRVVELQSALAAHVAQLQQALASVRQLQGLLPICSYCKRIRNDQNYWEQLETYLSDHTEASFSHGICPSCYQSIMKPQLESAAADKF
ncbi:MAG TPA: response regulator [Terriglobales bacterium]|nr:response regulator [Terriglobales bacterium]